MNRRTLHYELVRIVVSSGALATLVLAIGVLVYDRVAFREHLLDRLDVQATVVGESCTAALAFDDARDAAELLRAMRVGADVVQAAVYRRSGSLLASYRAAGFEDGLPAAAPGARRSFGDEDGAVVVKPIRHRGDEVGTIYVRARTDTIDAHFRQLTSFLLLLFTGVGAVLGAVLLRKLKRTITTPVHELAEIAAAVRATGDCSRRARIRGDDELAVLADGFNRMLGGIEERDAELARQRRTLEDTVAQRTAELATKSEQLAHAQKMEALGRLAGGVAHDFNNLLAIVIADSDALAEELPPGEHRAWAAEIGDAGRRGAALTRQLLAFGRKQVLNPQPVDVAAAIAAVSKMLSRIIGEDIRLVMDVGAGVRDVYMDPVQLEQALVNLALNARDAMPAGGTLRFEVSEEHVAAGEAPQGARHGEYVRVSVSDTGCGMEPDVLKRIFEPFFTTKAQGKGTGLGLAMVHGAVEQSGGHLTVQSTPGAGTTFTLFLPAMQRIAEAPAASLLAEHVPLGSGETVLLVEDDPQLRAAVHRMLAGGGYRVIEAESGAEALTRLHLHSIDLVLTDLVMPGIGGLSLGRILTEQGAATPVLYMSGYSDEMLSATGLPSPDHFIAKPFARDELLRRIRPLLAATVCARAA